MSTASASAMRNIQPRHALYRAAQVRAIDAAAIAGGVPGLTLMQRAGAALLDHLLLHWPGCHGLLIFVGGGNNGGDGYVLAQLAAEHGLTVRLIRLVSESVLQGDARRAAELACSRRIERLDWDAALVSELLQRAPQHTVIVDAMLGTGISGPLREPFALAVTLINAAQRPVLAVDMPSGLDSDSGSSAGGEAVKATLTLTFIALKRGLFTAHGPACTGELRFARLQVADDIYTHAAVGAPTGRWLQFADLRALLVPRRADAHKGEFGHVLVIGGDHGYGGAALMAAEAAARSGAGTVTLLTRGDHVGASLTRCPEVMARAVDDAAEIDHEALDAVLDDLLSARSVIVIGPGLGHTSWSRALLAAVLRRQVERPLPLVVDADALNLLAEACHGGADALLPAALRLPHPHWLLTPHPGEAARLLAVAAEQVQEDRFGAISQLQQRWGGSCLLKGAGTLMTTASAGDENAACIAVDVCADGNPGMASGGMGDVLAGILGGLLSQAPAAGWQSAEVLRLGVCLHAASADRAAARHGQMSLLATDLLPAMASLLADTSAESSATAPENR